MESELQSKLQKWRKELNGAFLERKPIIDGLLATLLQNGNAVIFGPPGTSKSYMIQSICENIDGAVFFNRLLFKTMPPEDLLGQASLKELQENDRLVRNTTSRLPAAHIAFLDEIFKSSPATLNALLRITCEREFDNPQPAKIPLIFLCGASNEIPEEPEMQAFLDRFLYKPWVKPLRREASRRSLVKRAIENKEPELKVRFTLDDIEQMRGESLNVDVPDSIIDQIMLIHREINKENFYLSDRKLMRLIELLKAYAYVQGYDAVITEHLHELIPECIGLSENEIKEILKIIKEKCPTVTQQAREWYDRAKMCAAEVVESAADYRSNPLSKNEAYLFSSIDQATKNITTLKKQISEANENGSGDTGKVDKILKNMDDLLLEVAGYRDEVLANTLD